MSTLIEQAVLYLEVIDQPTSNAPQEVAAALAALEDLTKLLDDVKANLVGRLEAATGHRWTYLEGVGRVRIARSPGKRYDNDRVLSAVAARIADELVDRESGEVPPVAVLVERTCQEMAALTGAATPSFTGWRKGALKLHGLTLDPYELPGEPGNPRPKIEREEDPDDRDDD